MIASFPEKISAEHLSIRSGIKANQQLLALAQGRSAQIAGRAKQHGEQVGAARFVFAEVEAHYSFALGSDDF
jgi:hypothetical protein